MDGVFTTLDDLCENWQIYKHKIDDLEKQVTELKEQIAQLQK